MQITVRYPCVTDSESGHDRFLFIVDYFESVALNLFLAWKYSIEFVLIDQHRSVSKSVKDAVAKQIAFLITIIIQLT